MTTERAPIPGPMGRVLASCFGVVVARRNARYDAGRGLHAAPIPVICVGNISVGGVGKTPMVRRVARTLLYAGLRPAILLRGYGSKNPEDSDEAAEHRAAMPGVRVEVDPDRVAAARRLAALGADDRPGCIILDDGFQHRRLARALDIVLIDARRSPWRDRLLPAGRLREPPGSLTRAGAIVLTHSDIAEEPEMKEIRDRLAETCPGAPVALAAHVWTVLRRVGDDSDETLPTDWLRGRRVAVACSIGEPGQFLSMLERAGAKIVDRSIGRDHSAIPPGTLARLADSIEPAGGALVITAKDRERVVRAFGHRRPSVIVYPELKMEVTEGAERLDRLILAAACAAT